MEQSKDAVFNEPNFNKEAYNKLEKLVNLLYDQVMDKSHRKYPLDQLAGHIH
jgi:hypothetical protein